METEWQRQQYVSRKRLEFIDFLSGIEWSNGGWRGNGDDASPSAFRNASSGVTSSHPDDPLVKWAEGLWERVVQVVDFEFIAKRGSTDALAQYLGVQNNWALQHAVDLIRARLVPEGSEDGMAEVVAIYERLAPPPPFTLEERRGAMLRWRKATGYRGVLTTHESEYFFSEEVLLVELNRLAKVFPDKG